jgi:hypothetical protein
MRYLDPFDILTLRKVRYNQLVSWDGG